MRTNKSGMDEILDIMLPPRQDMRDELEHPVQSKITGGRTRSDFKDQRSGRIHGGLDINYGGPRNSAGNPPVFSPVEGEIVGLNARNSTIVIRDKNGIEHEFMHFEDREKMQYGQQVKIGDKLGTMGNKIEGVQNGAHHVHYEMSVTVNGEKYLLDPEAYHNGAPMDQVPILDEKKQRYIDSSTLPDLQDRLRQEQERRDTARREREERDKAQPQPLAPGEDRQPDEERNGGPGGPSVTDAGEAARMAQDAAWESGAPGRAPQRPGQRPGQNPLQGPEQPLPNAPDVPNGTDGNAETSFLREERGMPRRPSGIELYGAETLPGGGNLQGGPLSLAEQPLPRPINLLADPLGPEDDPEGLEREAWELWRQGLPVGAVFAQDQGLPAVMRCLRASPVPPKRDRPPGYVAPFPEPDEEGGDFFPERRVRSGASQGLPGVSEEMSTLDFVKETFRLAAEGAPETPRPKRPAWFKPSNPEELTTEEYIWEIFNPRAAKQSRW